MACGLLACSSISASPTHLSSTLPPFWTKQNYGFCPGLSNPRKTFNRDTQLGDYADWSIFRSPQSCESKSCEMDRKRKKERKYLVSHLKVARIFPICRRGRNPAFPRITSLLFVLFPPSTSLISVRLWELVLFITPGQNTGRGSDTISCLVAQLGSVK